MIPTALRVVATLQLLGGMSALGGMIDRLGHGELYLDVGVLGIPAFFGLIWLKPGWRTFVLIVTLAWLVAMPVLFILGLAVAELVPAEVRMFGLTIATLSALWMSALMVPLFLLLLWQFRVLTRPDVAALFAPER
jgi:hypothetical protein